MMLKSSKLLFFTSLFTTTFLFSQTSKKTLNIQRSIHKTPKIDGILDDDAWKNVDIAKDFVMLQPNNGAKELDTHKTEVKVLYNDEAIFISAMMYDPEPSKIAMEFTSRDNFAQTDFFFSHIKPK